MTQRVRLSLFMLSESELLVIFNFDLKEDSFIIYSLYMELICIIYNLTCLDEMRSY